MKLYTEEQVKEIYFKGVHNGRLHIEGKCSDEVESLTPIELPSDEEIAKEATDLFGKTTKIYISIIQCKAFKGGAKWMRNKIQGGEQ
jgi:hypothetical protein